MARRSDFIPLLQGFVTLYHQSGRGPYRAQVEHVGADGVTFRLDSGDVASAPYARIRLRKSRGTGATVVKLTEGGPHDG